MRATRINHLSVIATDLEISARFYEQVFGLERIPTPNFGFPALWLRIGEQQLHLFKFDEEVPYRQHLALEVDDFHAVYREAKRRGILDHEAFYNCMYELPDGAVQMYLRDPAGNLIEIDWPDVATLDRSQLPELKRLADRNPQIGEAARATLFHTRGNGRRRRATASGG
jgi:lactoylglutathione lyase